ncbi:MULTISPECIES: DUF1934 domain-containing protein [unclassified Sporosarcina]|uniref:DUF1934 domain-containing protein n=1 Tax=unclassified Sporosarcina TaxID=2647733 RepID=UPI000C167176|nr:MULTISPECIES: DUF1934 domain-containing protein [unclassified Sporosarcina]PIC98187.1 hypothetical protein CSV68_14480 [Sporosarcina sp. P29]PID05309.1 hypothetical protein CSV66_10565 [Sporosarcina sp. P30]PID08427.1 hypothetical protein CSV65_10970 [Sporosarcina sp. P31]PID12245.1 hypothetical protein CSV64_07665 [Sporosarcina sp. P32b]
MEAPKMQVQLRSVIQHPEQQAETHTMQATGEIIEKKGQAYLLFEERLEGMPAVRTTVKLHAEDAFIMRKGGVQMRLPFRQDDVRFGTYGNGPAVMDLAVRTNQLEWVPGRFTVAYDLHSDDSLLGKYHLTITYSEVTQ